MKNLDFGRRRLGICVTAMLVGCGGSQPPIGAPGATPQNRPPAASSPYQTLYRFHPWTGTHPEAGLLDVNGVLYGTTTRGGLSGMGTVYRISPSGLQKAIYRFRGGSDGSDPQSGLLDVNGTLYGTTHSGGGSGCYYGQGCGTIFSVTPSGTEKVLYAFKGGADGANPFAGLIDERGTLYGTTFFGGGSACKSSLGDGCGTVFSLTTSGQETVLHSFAGGSDGRWPEAELIDVKGVLYSTTVEGGGSCYGSVGCGTVYSITPAGVEKVLYAFKAGSDGNDPQSGLIDLNGMLYGTTSGGGQVGSNCEYGNLCGTVYRISTKGAEKVLYHFADGSDGAVPQAGLIEVNGVMYGTTTTGGGTGSSCFAPDGNCGTVYSITTSGAETVVYRFTGGTDGWDPVAPLTNVNGTLYGTTKLGGRKDVCCRVYGFGTVFELSP
jgi:uncharacterized repeat protein (TIGR03803 family)